jgi:AAA family ATP:ADP antiporter
VLPMPEFSKGDEPKKTKKEKPKMTMGESFRFLASSKYLGLIAILVVAYGISINLVEVSWKNQLRLQYPLKADYSAFTGMQFILTGIATMIMILIGSVGLRVLGWRKAALATPIVIGITGLFFFACVIFPDFFTPVAMLFDATPLMLSVTFGLIQSVLSKSTKYALFDPTKEMSYIPLDQESKMKGKAAVDVVGARLGKSGGSLMQQGMFAFIGPVAVIAPYSAVIMLFIVAIWMFAVYALSKRFEAAQKEQA